MHRFKNIDENKMELFFLKRVAQFRKEYGAKQDQLETGPKRRKEKGRGPPYNLPFAKRDEAMTLITWSALICLHESYVCVCLLWVGGLAVSNWENRLDLAYS